MEDKILQANECSCLSCGATMRYSPEKMKLFCDNCKSVKEIEFVPIKNKHLWEEKDTLKSQKEFVNQTKFLKCPNCGANVALNNLEYGKTCPYCDTNLVSRFIKENSLAPDAILPFLFSDEEASKKYKAGIKRKWFVPNAFKKEPPVDSIKGVYIPSFGYDADTISKYVGKLGTEHVNVDRNGNRHVYTTYRTISGQHKSKQVDVLVETSSKINQTELMKIEPFNLSKAVEFKQGFIMGYTVEVFEESLEECKKIADSIIADNIKHEILSKYHYDTVVYFNADTTQTNIKYQYYLLPIYISNYKYKNKNYKTIMNGQTGQVGGGYPKSGIKITFFVLAIILLVLGLIFLFLFFGDGRTTYFY